MGPIGRARMARALPRARAITMPMRGFGEQLAPGVLGGRVVDDIRPPRLFNAEAPRPY
jgi:hypothetical protein